jgi:hypothetical protein
MWGVLGRGEMHQWFLEGKPERKRSLAWFRLSWEDTINVDRQEIACGRMALTGFMLLGMDKVSEPFGIRQRTFEFHKKRGNRYNDLRGTPSGSRKKPNAGRSRHMPSVDGRSKFTHAMQCQCQCRAHAAHVPRWDVALRSRFQNGMVAAWHGRGMECVNQTWPQLWRSHGKDTI